MASRRLARLSSVVSITTDIARIGIFGGGFAAPTYYSPYGSNKSALGRAPTSSSSENEAELAYITANQYNQALSENITFLEKKPDTAYVRLILSCTSSMSL